AFTLTPSLVGGIDQLRQTNSRFIVTKQTFSDPKSGTPRSIVTAQNINEGDVSTMPHVDFRITGKSTGGLTLDAGAGLILGSRETYTGRDKGEGFEPPLTKDASTNQEIEAQIVDLDDTHQNEFHSGGLKAHLDVGYEGSSHGFGLHSDCLIKKGTRQS